MTNKIVTYTSSLPNMVMEEVVEYAQKKNVSKNKVIEIALKRFFEEEIKQELQDTFQLASKDKELVQLAEEGLGDYLNQLKELEK